MIFESQNCQGFIAGKRIACVLIFVLTAAVAARAQGQPQKPSLPDPVKFVNKFDIVWNVVRAVFDDMGYATELEDKKAGRITTKPYEFITGSLTSSEVDKVAVKNDTITGSWLKARYTVEALLEMDCRKMWISTFHALCARILRRDGPAMAATAISFFHILASFHVRGIRTHPDYP